MATTIIKRKTTKPIRVGNITIGGKNPIVIQEMTNTYTADIDKTVRQIKELEDYGVKLMRVAVPNIKSAYAIKEIKTQVNIPLIADIHFDYRLALISIESGIDKLRINPGNIGNPKNIAKVAAAAKEREIPIRIGVNSGSLDKKILKKYGGVTAQGMVESALNEISLLEKNNFYDIIISLKSSDVNMTVEANKLLSSKIDYPIHIGITESGYGKDGMVRSIVGVGILLMHGIGDTIRISLITQDRRDNIKLCRDILDQFGIPYI